MPSILPDSPLRFLYQRAESWGRGPTLTCSKGLLEERRAWSWELEVRSTTVSRADAAQPSPARKCAAHTFVDLSCVVWV